MKLKMYSEICNYFLRERSIRIIGAEHSTTTDNGTFTKACSLVSSVEKCDKFHAVIRKQCSTMGILGVLDELIPEKRTVFYIDMGCLFSNFCCHYSVMATYLPPIFVSMYAPPTYKSRSPHICVLRADGTLNAIVRKFAGTLPTVIIILLVVAEEKKNLAAAKQNQKIKRQKQLLQIIKKLCFGLVFTPHIGNLSPSLFLCDCLVLVLHLLRQGSTRRAHTEDVFCAKSVALDHHRFSLYRDFLAVRPTCSASFLITAAHLCVHV